MEDGSREDGSDGSKESVHDRPSHCMPGQFWVLANVRRVDRHLLIGYGNPIAKFQKR